MGLKINLFSQEVFIVFLLLVLFVCLGGESCSQLVESVQVFHAGAQVLPTGAADLLCEETQREMKHSRFQLAPTAPPQGMSGPSSQDGGSSGKCIRERTKHHRGKEGRKKIESDKQSCESHGKRRQGRRFSRHQTSPWEKTWWSKYFPTVTEKFPCQSSGILPEGAVESGEPMLEQAYPEGLQHLQRTCVGEW